MTFSPGLEVTSANLKRWLEEEDIESLETAVLEGYGDRVKVKAQVISGPGESLEGNVHVYVNETLPKIMNKIRSIHAAVSCGDVTCLQDQLDKNDYVLAKDHLGMAPMTKAVILGHVRMVQLCIRVVLIAPARFSWTWCSLYWKNFRKQSTRRTGTGERRCTIQPPRPIATGLECTKC